MKVLYSTARKEGVDPSFTSKFKVRANQLSTVWMDDSTGWIVETKHANRWIYEEPLMSISLFDRVRYVGLAIIDEQIMPGDIGYVIEDYDDGNFEVEFSAPDGTTRAIVVLAGHDLEVAQP